MRNTALVALFFAAACTSVPTPERAAATALIIQVVPLEHTTAADMSATLARLDLPEGARVVKSGEGNAMVVSGTPEVVNRVLEVIARADQPAR